MTLECIVLNANAIKCNFNFRDIDYNNYSVNAGVSSEAFKFFNKTRSAFNSKCHGSHHEAQRFTTVYSGLYNYK